MVVMSVDRKAQETVQVSRQIVDYFTFPESFEKWILDTGNGVSAFEFHFKPGTLQPLIDSWALEMDPQIRKAFEVRGGRDFLLDWVFSMIGKDGPGGRKLRQKRLGLWAIGDTQHYFIEKGRREGLKYPASVAFFLSEEKSPIKTAMKISVLEIGRAHV